MEETLSRSININKKTLLNNENKEDISNNPKNDND